MIAASFVVSEGSLSASPRSGPADVASCLAAGTRSSQSDDSATSVTVDGALAIRAESAEERWEGSGFPHTPADVLRLFHLLVEAHESTYGHIPCHLAFAHLPDPRLMPLLLYVGIWAAAGDREERLRMLCLANDSGAVELPIVEEFSTGSLGRGLRVMRYRNHEDGTLYAALRYAWRSEDLQTDLVLNATAEDLGRLQRAIPGHRELRARHHDHPGRANVAVDKESMQIAGTPPAHPLDRRSQMNKAPSSRWLWTGLAVFGGAAAMGLTAMVTAGTGAPQVVSQIFVALMLPFGIAAFILICIGGTKLRAENRQLVSQVITEGRAAKARRDTAN
jgi:hypothetical protein